MTTSTTNTPTMNTPTMNTPTMNTEKWERGIDATTTDVKEIKAFVDWRLSIYKENGWKGFDLWESFVDDLETFTKDILDNLGKDRLKKLRDYLRENGVYVRKEARKSIAEGLLEVIYEQTPSEWPPNESISDPPKSTIPSQTTGKTPDQTPDQISDQTTAKIPDQTLGQTLHQTPGQTPSDQTSSSPTAKVTQTMDQLTLQGDFGKEINNLTKPYTDEEMKYSGEQDNFDFKYKIFQNYCLRASVLKQAYIVAIPIMLCERALKYYFTHFKGFQLIENMCTGLRAYFEGDEHKRDIPTRWNGITLKQIIVQQRLDTG